MKLFVDTTVWFSAVYKNDRSNELAKEILGAGDELVTTDHVLLESWLLLRSRSSRDLADRFWEGLRQGVASIETVTSADLESAWQIGLKFPDQDFSITDRTSFAFMERTRLARVATFDDDFAIYRYGRGGDRAFEVVR